MNGFALIAMQEYQGFNEVMSRIAAVDIPDQPADNGITGWPGIITGVLYQARQEAWEGDISADKWLKSDDCREFCVAIGFNHNIVLDWVKKPHRRRKGK